MVRNAEKAKQYRASGQVWQEVFGGPIPPKLSVWRRRRKWYTGCSLALWRIGCL